MKHLLLLITLSISLYSGTREKTLYDFQVRTIEGHLFNFSTLKGKKVLLVNTASKCSLSPQYGKLQELYEIYGGDDFEIIAFPCNDFGKREPESNNQIAEFCQRKYGITFPVMEKIKIRGEDRHPLYKWLTSSNENGTLDAKVIWNFQKFMIDEKGRVQDFVAPVKGPMCKKIIDWLNDSGPVPIE